MSRARGKKAEAIEQSITAFVGMERNSMPSIRYTANFLGASPTCEANCSGQVGAWSLVRFLSRFKRQWCVHGRILLLQWPALPHMKLQIWQTQLPGQAFVKGGATSGSVAQSKSMTMVPSTAHAVRSSHRQCPSRLKAIGWMSPIPDDALCDLEQKRPFKALLAKSIELILESN